MSGRPRDLETFRPYAAEMPLALLARSGAAPEDVAQVVALDLVRVAKLRGEIVAAYGIRPLGPVAYQLVALAVEPAWRGRRFGRWMLGHALGLAESRGGREVWVQGCAHERFLARAGFAPIRCGWPPQEMGPEGGGAAHLYLALTPE